MVKKCEKELKEKMLKLREFCKENKIEYLSICVMVKDDYVSFNTYKENWFKFGKDKWNKTNIEKR